MRIGADVTAHHSCIHARFLFSLPLNEASCVQCWSDHSQQSILNNNAIRTRVELPTLHPMAFYQCPDEYNHCERGKVIRRMRRFLVETIVFSLIAANVGQHFGNSANSVRHSGVLALCPRKPKKSMYTSVVLGDKRCCEIF